LVRRIRYAFELLRPEELTILRQWRDGDAFDYRALLDYALDKKAGLMPSDRLFIKRMKRVRDVATLLLVDLSRSTANTVDQRDTTVLDVEKQAIVLLCEALMVVGDRFAIGGFSGTGPLGVDYYRIKDLDAPFDDAVKGRIGAMAPQRSTRMGAAIRHATALLSTVQARVRLIIIMGDGFPNDLAYKGRLCGGGHPPGCHGSARRRHPRQGHCCQRQRQRTTRSALRHQSPHAGRQYPRPAGPAGEGLQYADPTLE
jgi:nitric oxide reductase NorD protein